jgi:hypothetical protein
MAPGPDQPDGHDQGGRAKEIDCADKRLPHSRLLGTAPDRQIAARLGRTLFLVVGVESRWKKIKAKYR